LNRLINKNSSNNSVGSGGDSYFFINFVLTSKRFVAQYYSFVIQRIRDFNARYAKRNLVTYLLKL